MPNQPEIAFFRPPTGGAWLGTGPFTALADCPTQGTAFYINDFDLSDPLPWKVPTTLHRIDAMEALAPWMGIPAPLLVRWGKPATEGFKMAFRRIRREVLAGRLDKMVPALTAHGELATGHPLSLLAHAFAAPEQLWGYGFARGEESGFVGATPELLFETEGSLVRTMALAGTAKPGDDEAFISDVKEIEEHEFVVRFLASCLGTLGDVQRQPRTLLETVGLRHFRSLLQVQCREPASADQLVPLLHPTPAVGCLPRTKEWLSKLAEYRTLLRVPGFFGAPFGFSHDGKQTMVVSIRGLSWQGTQIALPSGCGIVGGSAFDHEWRELRMKREAVARLLHLSSAA
jgi:menaquinone-specific isochorismate synthase